MSVRVYPRGLPVSTGVSDPLLSGCVLSAATWQQLAAGTPDVCCFITITCLQSSWSPGFLISSDFTRSDAGTLPNLFKSELWPRFWKLFFFFNNLSGPPAGYLSFRPIRCQYVCLTLTSDSTLTPPLLNLNPITYFLLLCSVTEVSRFQTAAILIITIPCSCAPERHEKKATFQVYF